MKSITKITRNGQITLPAAIRKILGVEEGDYVELDVADGQAVLRPKKLIDKDQAYFWTPQWQAAERRADEDIAAGRVHSYDTVEEAIDALHKRAAIADSKRRTISKRKARPKA